MATRMQQRRGTAAQWISTNSGNGPILNAGEIGFETDTNKFKIGDGTNHWINLDYFIDANSTVNPAFGSSIVFEGATANAFETTVQVTDPTADRTITLPDATGTVVLADGSGNVTVSGDLTVSGTTTTINSTTINATTGIVFEGLTANAFETTLAVADPTADRTLTLPDETGTVATQAYVDSAASNATFDSADSAGTGLDWNASTSQFDIDSTVTTNTGTQTLTNKTLTSPVITGAVFNDGSIVFEGSTENAHETTFTVTDPTADRTITFPDATGTVALTANVAALSGATFTGAVAGTDLTLSGNLTVNGTTTSIVSSELVIADKNITLSATQSPTNLTANGGGITVKGSTDKTFSYTEASDQWSSSESINIPTGKSYRINGVSLGTVSETLSNKTISSSDNTISLTPSNITGVTVTATEINYLNGVTSAIQTQINTKASTSELSTHASDTTAIHGISDTSLLVTTTGAQTLTNKTITSPSGLVKSDVGLGNVDNTSDASKPVSTAAQTALDLKAPLANPTFTGTVSGITKTMVGLGSVDNTADTAKPVSTAQQTALDLKANLSGATFTGAVSGTSLTLSGDLTVNGTTTTLNATTLSVDDKNIELGSVASPSDVTADGGGITLKGATDKTFNWVDATDSWTSSEHINLASGKDLKVNGTAVISSTAGGFIFTDGTQTLEGVPSRTPIIQKTASYTLSSLTERDDLIEMGSASALTLTIPPASSVDYPIGTSIDILQTGAGQVTVAAGAGVTVNATPGLKLRTQWSSATLFKRAANTWVVFGDLTA